MAVPQREARMRLVKESASKRKCGVCGGTFARNARVFVGTVNRQIAMLACERCRGRLDDRPPPVALIAPL
jgi:hypothetical protein